MLIMLIKISTSLKIVKTNRNYTIIIITQKKAFCKLLYKTNDFLYKNKKSQQNSEI